MKLELVKLVQQTFKKNFIMSRVPRAPAGNDFSVLFEATDAPAAAAPPPPPQAQAQAQAVRRALPPQNAVINTSFAHDNIAVSAELEAAFNEFFQRPLTPQQKQAVAFMLEREAVPYHDQFGGIICNEVGTGKTATCLSVIYLADKVFSAGAGITVVVAPAATVHTWKDEITRHLRPGALQCVLFHGEKRETRLESVVDTVDVVVTSYGLVEDLISFLPAFSNRGGVKRVVLDEAHTIRNTRSETAWHIRNLKAKFFPSFRWCVTATPIWNAVDDIYPLLEFLDVRKLCSREDWTRFLRPKWLQVEVREETSSEALARLSNFLRPITLRQARIEADLPPREERVTEVVMSENERLFYDALQGETREVIEKLFRVQSSLQYTEIGNALRNRAGAVILDRFLRARQACVHPLLVLGVQKKTAARDEERRSVVAASLQRLGVAQAQAEVEECAVCYEADASHAAIPCGHRFCGNCFAIMEELSRQVRGKFQCPLCRSDVEQYLPLREAAQAMQEDLSPPVLSEEPTWPISCSKLEWILADMRERRSQDPDIKFLIFSQWVSALDLCERFFTENGGIQCARITGTQSIKKRADVQREFTDGGGPSVLLVSLMAGGVGINLQRASVVYHLDPWWTAARTDQASGRVYRIGQTRSVVILHLVATDTVESRVMQMQHKKRKLGSDVFSMAQQIREAFNININ